MKFVIIKSYVTLYECNVIILQQRSVLEYLRTGPKSRFYGNSITNMGTAGRF